MTSNQFPPVGPTRETADEPRSVARDGDRAASALRAIHQMFESGPGQEERAWMKLELHRQRPHRAPFWAFIGAIAATGAIVIAARFVGKTGPQGSATPSQIAERPRASQPPPAPAAIPVGSTTLPGGLRAELRAGGRARWLPVSRERGQVVLESGTLEIDAPSPVDVRVASLRIDGSAGRFTIRADDGGVDVVVEKGEAVVWSSQRVVRRVVAGERWVLSDLAEKVNAPAPRPATRAAPARGKRAAPRVAMLPAPSETPIVPAPEPRDCLRVARDGVTDDAISCFEGQAKQSGLTGEIALLELARIRRDVKGDLEGAERLLAEHRRRFGRSALASEARIIHVELLLRLGRAGEALAEAERLPGVEAIFWRATCLARLGRREEAVRAFDDYLRQEHVERRSEALRKRAEIEGR